MIPLVSTESEIRIMKDLVIKTASKVQKEQNLKIEFLVGTMIELPRAAIKAKEIAKKVNEDFDQKKLPLMLGMINAIVDDKKLELDWESFR